MTVRQARLDAGLSQLQLQDRTGIRQSIISHVERGRLPLWPKYRSRIADALGIDPAELSM